jgi:hypothetical protein
MVGLMEARTNVQATPTAMLMGRPQALAQDQAAQVAAA